jgi:hypothetical protein
LARPNFFSDYWLVSDPHSTPFHAPVSKLGGETPSRIMVWSLIRNKKTIVLFERHFNATEKSEDIVLL